MSWKQKDLAIAQKKHHYSVEYRSIFGPKGITLKAFFLPDGVKKTNFLDQFCEREFDSI